eukprot:2009861-Rhodomonas_salina.1
MDHNESSLSCLRCPRYVLILDADPGAAPAFDPAPRSCPDSASDSDPDPDCDLGSVPDPDSDPDDAVGSGRCRRAQGILD